jgi:hypothetical protein
MIKIEENSAGANKWALSLLRKKSKEGGMKKLGLWVKVKPPLGSCHLRSDVSRFTDESRADVTRPCTKIAQNLHEFSSSLSSQLHEQMSCWTQVDKAMHCGWET